VQGSIVNPRGFGTDCGIFPTIEAPEEQTENHAGLVICRRDVSGLEFILHAGAALSSLRNSRPVQV
jgi:hypothetical protein